MKVSMHSLLRQFAAVATLILASVPTSASADTLDFTVFPLYYQGSTVMVLPQATITSLGTDLFVGGAGIDHEICAIDSSGLTCAADMKIDFTSAVNGLSFVTSGWQSGDHIDVNVFSGVSLLGVVGQSNNGLVDLTSFSNVTSLFIDDSSTAAGMAYDGFNFTVAAVPEPETYAMLLAGLGLLGFAARRRHLS